MCVKSTSDATRQHRHPVLAPLALSDGELAALGIDVLDPQVKSLLQAEPGAIEKCHDQPRRAVEPREHRRDLGPRQHHGQSTRRRGADDALEFAEVLAEHYAVEKQHRAERLVLRRRADVVIRCKGGHELGEM